MDKRPGPGATRPVPLYLWILVEEISGDWSISHTVSQINPFTGAIIQSTQVQRTQAAEKDRQLRHAADIRKNSATGNNRFEHAVESSEQLSEVQDQSQRDRRGGKQRRPKAGTSAPEQATDQSSLDMTA